MSACDDALSVRQDCHGPKRLGVALNRAAEPFGRGIPETQFPFMKADRSELLATWRNARPLTRARVQHLAMSRGRSTSQSLTVPSLLADASHWPVRENVTAFTASV